MAIGETKLDGYEQMQSLMNQLVLAGLAVTTLVVALVALLGAG